MEEQIIKRLTVLWSSYFVGLLIIYMGILIYIA